MKNKLIRTISFLTVAIIMVALVACGQTDTDDSGDNNNSGKEYDVEITLYYVNNEYVLTGNESLDKLIPIKKIVNIKEESVEEAVVSELQVEPEDENLSTMLNKLKVLSVNVEDSIAYVDFSEENLSGGSLEESFILQQLVYSLTELDGINAVQVLVNGNKVESLMGHISIEEPLTRE